MKKVFQLEKNEGRIIKRWGKFVKLASQFFGAFLGNER